MRLSSGYLLALASVSNADKNRENEVIFSGNERNVWGEHCIAEQNEDGILTITTTKGLNEVTSCHRQLGCRDGYTLVRKIISIEGLQDCMSCELDEPGPWGPGLSCSDNFDHNAVKFKYSDVTESYCSESEEKNAGVAVGSWVNTNAQVVDFQFHLEVPVQESYMYIFGLYSDPYSAINNPEYDFDTYMSELAEAGFQIDALSLAYDWLIFSKLRFYRLN